MITRLLQRVFPADNQERNSEPREMWLQAVLRDIPAGSRILDAGAGEQAHKKYCDHLTYVAQDFAQYSGHGDGKGLQCGTWNQSHLDIVSDITAIPEPDGSFDAIMCTEVFEHLPSPLAALDEFARLLNPSRGMLILTAPFCAFTHQAPYFFGTGFSPYWYLEHLPSKGFEIIAIQANGNFPAYLAQETARIPYIAQRYCNMKLHPWEELGLLLTRSLLWRMYQADTSSQEFACFGYHVLARKRI